MPLVTSPPNKKKTRRTNWLGLQLENANNYMGKMREINKYPFRKDGLFRVGRCVYDRFDWNINYLVQYYIINLDPIFFWVVFHPPKKITDPNSNGGWKKKLLLNMVSSEKPRRTAEASPLSWLVGGWFPHPFEKYSSNWIIFPNFRGWKFPKICELPPPRLRIYHTLHALFGPF